MDTFVDEPTARFVVRSAAVDDATRLEPTVTKAHPIGGWRKAALVASLLAIPAAAGIAYARARPRRRLLAGSITAFALGALRVELARWFTPEPAFRADSKLGELEIRQCSARVEAVMGNNGAVRTMARVAGGSGGIGVRLSIAHYTTKDDIDRAVDCLLTLKSPEAGAP